MDEILKGLITGIIMAILIGPVFFALIQASIEKGVKSGVLMAIGISMSDTAYITFTYFGISQFSESAKFKIFLAIAGGLIMFVFGIRMFTRPVYHHSSKIHLGDAEAAYWKIFKGFILNGINPFVLLFWIGIVSLVTVHWEYTSGKALIFFLTLLTTIFLTDVGKVYLAHNLRNSITPRFMSIINRVVGIVFIILGIRLLFFAYNLGEHAGSTGQSVLHIFTNGISGDIRF
jgi:threonine/homoserine/homoserine lactone efflux protein